ncbi:MAG: cyclase family protein [Dehalococcoidia bacterium]
MTGLGTLNFITPAKRVAAAARYAPGRTVSLAPRPQYGHPARQPASGGAPHAPGRRRVGRLHRRVVCGYSTSHIDALCHIYWESAMYNGRPTSEVASRRPARSVHAWRDGIVSRGVLLDIAGARGVDWLEAEEAVHVDDLEAAERFGGVRVGEGDILLVRVGRWPRMQERGWETRTRPNTGVPVSGGLPSLAARAAHGGVRLADCFDQLPSGYERSCACRCRPRSASWRWGCRARQAERGTAGRRLS